MNCLQKLETDKFEHKRFSTGLFQDRAIALNMKKGKHSLTYLIF